MAFVALLAALLLVPAGTAGAKSPGDFSAADQYVETVPTSSGPSPTKEGKDRRTRLAEKVKAKLDAEGGKDATSLEEVATSDKYGAPQNNGGSTSNNNSRNRSPGSTTAVPSASVKAVSDSGQDLTWLLFALIAITGLMVGAVAYQRHKNNKSG